MVGSGSCLAIDRLRLPVHAAPVLARQLDFESRGRLGTGEARALRFAALPPVRRLCRRSHQVFAFENRSYPWSSPRSASRRIASGLEICPSCLSRHRSTRLRNWSRVVGKIEWEQWDQPDESDEPPALALWRIHLEAYPYPPYAEVAEPDCTTPRHRALHGPVSPTPPSSRRRPARSHQGRLNPKLLLVSRRRIE
jgi:hypothetical protein